MDTKAKSIPFARDHTFWSRCLSKFVFRVTGVRNMNERGVLKPLGTLQTRWSQVALSALLL